MANNVAYTSGMLIVHTDYPALHFAPGVSSSLGVRKRRHPPWGSE